MCVAAESAAFAAVDEAVTWAEGLSENDRSSAPRTACMAAVWTCEEEAARLSARSQCSDLIQKASDTSAAFQ